MTRHEFQQLIASELSSRLTNFGYVVKNKSVIKENDSVVDIIVISNNQRVSSTLKVDDMYHEYGSGIPFETIVIRILRQVLGGVPKEINQIADMISDFKSIKDQICASVVNSKMNSSWLSQRPHYDIFDLSIVYHLIVKPDDRDTMMRIQVTDKMFEEWGIEAHELHNTAMKNTNVCYPAVLSLMEQRLLELTPDDFLDDGLLDELLKKPTNMIVITNKMSLYGAIHMFNTDILRDAAQILMTNQLFILPSSVHEIVVCPVDIMSIKGVNSLVVDVNETIDPKDVLSNHIYLYDRNTNKISCA